MVLSRPAKAQAILDFPVPSTCAQLMCVLRMCGFYRHFIPNFAAITGPLTNLFRKDVRWKWSEECQEAFGKVKTILSSALVHRILNFQKPLGLQLMHVMHDRS